MEGHCRECEAVPVPLPLSSVQCGPIAQVFVPAEFFQFDVNSRCQDQVREAHGVAWKRPVSHEIETK